MAARPATLFATVCVALALSLALAGCANVCRPMVAVRNCGTEPSSCSFELGDRTLDWNPDLAGMFAPVARLINGTGEGERGEAQWANQGQSDAFWRLWGVPEGPDQLVFLRHEGLTYRVDDVPC